MIFQKKNEKKWLYTLDKKTLMVHHITLCNLFLGLGLLQGPLHIRKKSSYVDEK